MRVLVVEDERPLAAALQRGLANHGFAVETASDGLSGYLLARDEHFDAVVLDIMLPECNGFQVCERLRADDVQTPILMLTAMDDELDEAEALDLGADDFLRKPFSYLVLVARLHALLRRPEQRPTVLRSRAAHARSRPAQRPSREHGAGSDTARVLIARVPVAQRGPYAVKAGDPRACLGRRARTRPQRRPGLHRVPASKDRRAVRDTADPNGTRPRLPRGGQRRCLTAGSRCHCEPGWCCWAPSVSR